MPSYLLRIELEDRPGSLGSLAVAIGSAGADILSLDVVERGPGYAVDDLVVELPAGSMPDTLISAAEALQGVRVDAIRPYTGLLEAHRELELIDHVAAGADRDAQLRVLVDEAPRVLRVGWCTVVRLDGSGPHRVAGSPGAPETQAAQTPWLPLAAATALDGGHGVAHAPGAHAIEHVSLTPRDEFHRRIRVSAGVWQTSMRHLHLAHPRRGMVAYAFIGHRLLRSLVLPCLMPVLALSSIVLRRTLVGKVLLAGQALVYGAGALGAVTGAPALGVPFQFSMLNLAAIRGGYRYATGTQPVAWERMDRVAEIDLGATGDTIAA